MKNKLPSLITTIFFLFLFISCSSGDDTPVTIDPICKLLKYNKVLTNGPNYTFDAEFVYKNDLVVKRLRYTNILPSDALIKYLGVISEDSIVYDKNNNVEKIIYLEYRSNNGITTYKIEGVNDIFFYKENNTKPYKREAVTKDNNGKITYKWIETIQYDSKNRIIQTDGYDEERPNRLVRTKYNYDTNENLSQCSEITTYTNSVGTAVSEIKYSYSNYDTNKNPFKNIAVPFVEYRNVNYSNNNYRTYTSETVDDVHGIISSYVWKTSLIEYNKNGYPLFAEYECN